ncbi:hypothetical protein [Ramlibacter sp.]|uniref:hypothetical protein n=1 Tax=Ramlibacter sp. TaxID=1917967 RepID=UPI002FCA99BF
MIQLQLQVELAYEIRSPAGADLIFNVHAAQTGQQTVSEEELLLSQPVIPDVAMDPATATRFMRPRRSGPAESDIPGGRKHRTPSR